MMRIVLLIFLSLPILGCDIAPVRSDVGGCMEHTWIKGTFKIQSKEEELDIKLKNVSGGDDRVISTFDRGWSEVKCP
ncbi:MAG: hypothetical protein A2622_00670 [Bdellovibrionales bacterium RIFCSPHIGHO2_01_FULL_40_29]|nr:MAG: hypothetical protein A2622_00670 [Bdellovibrionales bacterium RIFCSPHIGHO2_01_FULL_40_29]OFZ32632.1 MAG: hypothetical protein A3D17_05270 [Bdellovibrionales bacterium RIFCSPHIGHO2_02_FULL_40_15]